MAGKGDKTRPTNGEKYRSNYDAIFKKRPECKPVPKLTKPAK